jgi:hypothetical protein
MANYPLDRYDFNKVPMFITDMNLLQGINKPQIQGITIDKNNKPLNNNMVHTSEQLAFKIVDVYEGIAESDTSCVAIKGHWTVAIPDPEYALHYPNDKYNTSKLNAVYDCK